MSISFLSRNNASILVLVIKINDTRHAFIKPTLKLFYRNIDGMNKILSDKLKKEYKQNYYNNPIINKYDYFFCSLCSLKTKYLTHNVYYLV